MVEISQEELDELREKAARAGQGEPGQDPAERRGHEVPHRALLADGTVHDYTGAHPTHVSKEGPDGREQRVPVLAVYPA